MKKVILSAVALMAISVASAQESRFGAKAGLNLATLTGDVEDTNMKVGFHVGAFAEFMISEKFAIQPELLYSMQGAREEFSESAGGASYEEEIDYKLSYLNIPIMAKYYVTEDFNIQAGPQIGMLLSANAEFESTTTIGDESESTSVENDIKDSMETIDFGLNFGVGYNLTENLGLEARYNIGLSNIFKDSDDGESGDSEDFTVNNSVIQISIGYKF